MHTGRPLTKSPSFLSNSSHSASSPSSRISPTVLTKKPSQDIISIHPSNYSSKTRGPQSPLRSNASSKTLIIPTSSAVFNPNKIVRSQTDIFVSPSSPGSRSPSQGSPTLKQKGREYTKSSSSQSSLIKKDQVEISKNNLAPSHRKSEEPFTDHHVDQNFSFETPHNMVTSGQNKYEQLFYDKLDNLIQSFQDIKENMSPLVNPESFSSKTWEVENSTPSSLFTIYKNCEKHWKSFDDYALKFIIRNQMRESNGEDNQGLNCFLEELNRFEENLEAQKARIEEITSKRLKEKERAGEYIDILTKGLAEIKEKFNKDFDLVERQFETNRFTALLQSELKSMNQFTTQTYEKIQDLLNPPLMVNTQKKPIPQASPSYNSRSKEPTKDLMKRPGTSPSKSPLRKTPTARDTSPISPTVKKETPNQNNHNFQILKEYFEMMKDYNSRLIRIIHDVESEKLEIERLVLNAKDNIHLESNKLISQIENSFSSKIRSLQTTATDSSRSSQKVIGHIETLDKNRIPQSDIEDHRKEQETDAIDKIHSEFLLEEYKITTEDLSNKVRVLEDEAKNNRENTSQQIQILLKKIQTLSNEYELYKEEKERNLKAIVETKEEEVIRFLAIIDQKDQLINIIREENDILKKELHITSQIQEPVPITEETLDLEDFKNERNKFISMDMKEDEDQGASQNAASPKDKKKKQAVEGKTPKNLLKEENVLEMLFLELMQTKNKQKK